MFCVYICEGSNLYLIATFSNFGEAYAFMNKPCYKNIPLLLRRIL